jgi:SET domain-containing protein
MKTVLYKNTSIEPRKSDVHGWGVFTKEKISKGEIIEECHCLYMTDDEASYTHHLKPIKRYTIRVEDDGKLPYVIPFGYGALFNSSIDPNVVFKWDNENKLLVFYSFRDIEKDEELFLNYEINRVIVNTDLFTFN